MLKGGILLAAYGAPPHKDVDAEALGAHRSAEKVAAVVGRCRRETDARPFEVDSIDVQEIREEAEYPAATPRPGNARVSGRTGAVAQLVAHLVRNEGVRGSNPLSSTRE